MRNYTFLGRLFKEMFEGKLVHISSDSEENILNKIYDVAGFVRLRNTYCKTSVYTMHTSKYSDHIQHFKDVGDIPMGYTIYTPSEIDNLLRKKVNSSIDNYDLLCILAPLIENSANSIEALSNSLDRTTRTMGQRLNDAEDTLSARSTYRPNHTPERHYNPYSPY